MPPKRTTVAWAIAGAALLVYGITCCRTVFIGDSGELSLILDTGGIAHPPGYPLYTIVGFLWLKLLWFLTPAFAANLFSAAATAAAAAVLYFLLARTTEEGTASPWINAGVALSFAFSRPLWGSATNAEVYGLSALLYVAALLFVVRYYQENRPAALISAAFFCGLTLTHHFSSSVVALSLLVALWLKRKDISGRVLAAAVAAFLVPLTLYGYLLLRFDPSLPINWMTERSLTGLWRMFTADIYRQFIAVPTLGDIGLYGSRLIGLLAMAFGPGLALLALPGAAEGVYRKSPVAALIVLPAIANVVMVSLYHIPDFDGYLIPLFVAVVFLLRQSAALMPSRWRQRPGTTATIAAALTVIPLVFNVAACNLGGLRLAERYGRDLLDSAPEEGTVVLKSDNGSHPALYLRYGERYRPDLDVYATNSTLVRLTHRYGGGDYGRIVDSLDRVTGRVFRGAEYIINQGTPPGYPDRGPVGFLYGPGGVAGDRTASFEQRLEHFIRDSLDRIDLGHDLKVRQVCLEYRLWEIDRLMRRADQATVSGAIDRLRVRGKQIGDPHTCLAVSQFFRMRGATDEALAWVEIAFAAHPGSLARRDINIGLASIRRQRGELPEATAALEAALRLDPSSTAARYNLNLLKVESALTRNDYPAALEASIELTRLEPDNPLPYFNIGVIHDRLPGSQQKALEAYREFLRRGGNEQYPEAARRARERIELLTFELKRP